MKILSIFVTLLLILCFWAMDSKGCHYGGHGKGKDKDKDKEIEIEVEIEEGEEQEEDSNAKRRRRKRSTDITNKVDASRTNDLRNYFRDCMLDKLGDTLEWRSVVDFTVLDTIWFLYAADIACSEANLRDDAVCWKQCLSVLLRANSTLLEPAKQCVDQYIADTDEEKVLYADGALREVEQNVVITAPPQEYSTCIQEQLTDMSRGNDVASIVKFVTNDAFCSFCDYGVLPGTDRRPGFAENSEGATPSYDEYEESIVIRWPFRLEALTRRNSDYRKASEICNQDFVVRFQQDPPPSLGWANWRAWSACDAQCSQVGVTRRRRVCLEEQSNNCVGSNVQTMGCTIEVCATWSQWSTWSTCSASCGDGIRWSLRNCINGVAGSEGCFGESRKAEPCDNIVPCSVIWGQWMRCSVTCGTGTHTRIQINPPVDGKTLKQSRPCVMNPCATWSEWANWSRCSITCGSGGKRVRTRNCNGGLYCKGGISSEESPCLQVLTPCGATWSQWEGWSDCSYKRNTRTCIGGDGLCEGSSEIFQKCQGRVCEEVPTPGLVTMLTWSMWSHCKGSCGVGFKERTRSCKINGIVFEHESSCKKQVVERVSCPVYCFQSMPFNLFERLSPPCLDEPGWEEYCKSSYLSCSSRTAKKNCKLSCHLC